MKQLIAGDYFGQTNYRLNFAGITLTDTEYTEPKVDWHYHANPYLTFLLKGSILEGNKKETYTCTAGSLLFHNWQEPHFNIKPDGFTRGFHIEMTQTWIDRYEIALHRMQGSMNLRNPQLSLLLYRIVREAKRNDAEARLSIESLLLEAMSTIEKVDVSIQDSRPFWVRKLQELLHNGNAETLSLSELAAILDIHPVHLSRQFRKYFHCTLGEYIRKVKLNKALTLMPIQSHTLTGIAFESGFSDQSHFIRCFKESMGMTPLAYRRLVYR